MTLEEIRLHFAKSCSLNAIHKFVKSLGFVLKKTLKASEQDREDIIQARTEWKEFPKTTHAKRLVFLDESGIKTNMTRLYGRSFQGTRCHDSAPCGHWETVTVLSSVRLDGTTECVVFEGDVDRKIFDAYVQEMLINSLRPGDIIVMDNLSAHKSRNACDAIKKKQAELLFPPACSPDLNPIEKMWSKVKQVLRGIKARTYEELLEGVKTALNLVSANDARGWFVSCGYTQFKS
jgi:transposase